MGLATDATGIQFRMLNRSKGPAVWGPRAQADKYKYARRSPTTSRHLPEPADRRGRSGRDLGEGVRTGTEPAEASRKRSQSPASPSPTERALACRAAIVTTGTFLRALMHTGERKTEGGRVGEAAAQGLSGCLAASGLELGRLKTGTPPRLGRQSIDFAAFEPQPGDDDADAVLVPQRTCGGAQWLPPAAAGQLLDRRTPTTRSTTSSARTCTAPPCTAGRSPRTGPRYCPSIEDKVVRFADKDQPPDLPGARGARHRRDLLQRHQHLAPG